MGPPIPRWLIPAFALPALAYLIALGLDSDSLGIVAKPFPVIALAVAVAVARPRISYQTLVSLALALGALGDLLLELDFFVYGLVAFLIGHLFYIAAFLGDTRRLALKQALPFAAWGVALVAIVADGAGDLFVPVAVYAAVLCVMMWRALARMGTAPATAGRETAIGAVLFGISDSLIALDRFGPTIRGASLMIILTYWAAQGLIARDAMRHPR